MGAVKRSTIILNTIDKLIEAVGQDPAERDNELKETEDKIQKDMQEIFTEQEQTFMAKFEKAQKHFTESATDDMNRYLDETFTVTASKHAEKIKEGNQEAMKKAGTRLIAALGLDISFNLEQQRAVEYLQKHAAEMVSSINETTRARVKTIVVKGMQEGKSYGQVASELRERFEEFRVGRPQHHIRGRAEHIAVTEAAHGYEAGNREAADQIEDAGITLEKFWQTVGDDRVSDGCQQNERAGWIDKNQAFPSGHQRSPRFPGCRCHVQYRRKPDNTN